MRELVAVRRIIPVDSKACKLTPTEANLLHAKPTSAPCDVE